MAHPRGMTGGSRRAFTLVEMLIVVSIITILAGMLFPVMARARSRARQTACLSNERQLALALLQYSQDWDERLPCGAKWSTGQGWAGQVYAYGRNANIFRCPEDPGNVSEDDPDEPVRPGYRISYGMNGNTSGAMHPEFSAPAATVLLFEVNDAAAELDRLEWASPTGRGLPTENPEKPGKPFGADYYATGNLGGVSPTLSTTKRPYHDPVSNFLAADGHVKALQGGLVSPGLDAPSAEAPRDPSLGTAAGTSAVSTPAGGSAALTFSKL